MQMFRLRRAMVALVVMAATLASTVPGSAQMWSRGGRGEACGGITGITCQRGLWCQLPPSPFTCFIADGMGTCDVVPRFCPRIFRPVCGCNGKTYGNDCERRAARVQLAHDGRC